MSKANITLVLDLLSLCISNNEVTSQTVVDVLEIKKRTAQRYLSILYDFGFLERDESKKPYKYKLSTKVNNLNLQYNKEIGFINSLLNYSIELLPDTNKNQLNKIKSKLTNLNTNSTIETHYFLGDKPVKIDSLDNKHTFLAECILKKEICSFTYKSKKQYEVLPYKIIYFEGVWYLFGKQVNNSTIKTFSLLNIDNIKSTGNKFNLKETEIEELDDFLKNMHNIWYDKDNIYNVKIKIDKTVADYFKNKVFLRNQKIENEDEYGNLTVKFEVSNKYDFFFSISRWLPHIEVLSPKKYADELIKLAKKVLEKNEHK